ncbi:zinc finger protein 771-like [Anopheles bellator]|uniref:zinc finger protein 771-like n=1 Tax=Anopheles bellator TaxID=139047 RepID=UPI0026493134|nr:zinc finger protein 771-like [Anopheles bellator]
MSKSRSMGEIREDGLNELAASELENLVFSDICRCCMASKPRMKQLFSMNLDKMLCAVTGIKAVPSDGLPVQLCIPCVLEIRRAHFFKLQCETTEQKLRGYLNQSIFLNAMENEFQPETDQTEPDQRDQLIPVVLAKAKAARPTGNRGGADQQAQLAAVPSQVTTQLAVKAKPGSDYTENETVAVGVKECPKCFKWFETEKKMKRHLRIHLTERPHQCTECDMSFVEKSNLSKHMRKHTGELRNLGYKPHLCPECGKSFKYSTSLSRHKRMHTKRNVFTCPVCDKFYLEQNTLNVHMRTHTKERPFCCGICDKRFSQKPNLVRHERTHTGEKPFSCDQCFKGYSQKSYLVVHKRIHAREKPFDCPDCTMAFVSRNALMRHQRSACSVHPYRCTLCKKTFRYKKSLRVHRQNHLLESPHVCKYCPVRCISLKKLQIHTKKFHAKDHIAGSGSAVKANYRNRAHKRDANMQSEGEEAYEIEENIDADCAETGRAVQSSECSAANGGETVSYDEYEYDEDSYTIEYVDTTDPEMKKEPLLDIQIMNPSEEGSDIEQ